LWPCHSHQKVYLKAKEVGEFKYFTMQKYNFQKKSSKRNQNPSRRIMEIQIFHHAKIEFSKKSSKRNQKPSRYHNSTTNLKFQHKPKYHLSKSFI
jgi:hypothetical protein